MDLGEFLPIFLWLPRIMSKSTISHVQFAELLYRHYRHRALCPAPRNPAQLGHLTAAARPE